MCILKTLSFICKADVLIFETLCNGLLTCIFLSEVPLNFLNRSDSDIRYIFDYHNYELTTFKLIFNRFLAFTFNVVVFITD